jgi:hypothetical protein
MPDRKNIDILQRHPLAFALAGLGLTALGFLIGNREGDLRGNIGAVSLSTGLLLLIGSLVNWRRRRKRARDERSAHLP